MWTKCGLSFYLCNMATIKYFIQSANNPAGIYVRIREGRKIDAKAKTPFAVNPKDWNKEKGTLKNLKDENLKLLNQQLVLLNSNLLGYFNNSTSNDVIDSNWLKRFFSTSTKEEKAPLDLVEYYFFYMNTKKDEISKDIVKKLIVNRKMIERFQEKLKKRFAISEVNLEFVSLFNSYCLKEGYSQNTISRSIKYIKTICYHAQLNGIETSYQLKSMKIKTVVIDKITLSKNELKSIAELILENDYLDNARDWLLISCETAQRVSDFLRFSKNMVVNRDGIDFIEFTQVKTLKLMVLPLNETVQNILKKRNGDFPRKISDQKFNKYIKEICFKAGITQITKGSKFDPSTKRKVKGEFPKYELVSSHIGRRSFATNYYGIIPTSLLIAATGHQTEREFLGYIGKSEGENAKQLAEYFKKISNS